MKRLLFGLILMGSLLLVGCTTISIKEPVDSMNKTANMMDLQGTKIQEVDASDVDEFLKREDIGIIDARPKKEFERGTLDDRAILIEIKRGYLEKFKSEVNKLNKDKAWFIYCKSGMRSNKGAEIMIENGFKDVYELKGGLRKYRSQK
ncbi:MAG: hypothetical protein B6227_04430 [Fusobacteriia bacterium 4572_74]|nr:MAG: hypothetical protein B6227_04430 [Fusobacteriia bacterium 4572_74]